MKHWSACIVLGFAGQMSAFLSRENAFIQLSRIPGHELGVEVLEVGEKVTNIRAGDRCAVEPYINDPTSYASRTGTPIAVNDCKC